MGQFRFGAYFQPPYVGCYFPFVAAIVRWLRSPARWPPRALLSCYFVLCPSIVARIHALKSAFSFFSDATCVYIMWPAS